MHRRHFIYRSTLAAAALAAGAPCLFAAEADETPWRAFEITTRVDIAHANRRVRAWVPVPLTVATAYQRPGTTSFDAGRGSARLVKDAARGFGFVSAEWAVGVPATRTVTSRVRTRDIAVDLTPPPCGVR